MKPQRMIAVLLLLTCVLATQVATAAATNYELWTDPDDSGFKVIDYVTSKGKDLGQLHYEWIVDYLDNSVASYDYYAILLVVTITPDAADGSGIGRIESGRVTVDLTTSSQMVVDVLPGRTSDSYSYGTSVSINSAGIATFSSSTSVSSPDVDISPVTDANWGGQTYWNYDMMGDARYEQNTIRYTLLIRVTEGSALKSDITIYCKWMRGLLTYKSYETFTINFDGTPPTGGGGGGGGGGISPTPVLTP